MTPSKPVYSSYNQSPDYETCYSYKPKQTTNHRFIYATFYQGLVRSMIHGFKYQDQFYWRHIFQSVIADAILHAPWALPEVLVPIPLHHQRYCQRGFNQAYILAKILGRHFGIKTQSLLIREKNTPPLHTLSPQQRHQSMANAFYCKANTLQHIALIDDIYTTGATLKACSQAIININPGCKISWITLSRKRLKKMKNLIYRLKKNRIQKNKYLTLMAIFQELSQTLDQIIASAESNFPMIGSVMAIAFAIQCTNFLCQYSLCIFGIMPRNPLGLIGIFPIPMDTRKF